MNGSVTARASSRALEGHSGEDVDESERVDVVIFTPPTVQTEDTASSVARLVGRFGSALGTVSLASATQETIAATAAALPGVMLTGLAAGQAIPGSAPNVLAMRAGDHARLSTVAMSRHEPLQAFAPKRSYLGSAARSRVIAAERDQSAVWVGTTGFVAHRSLVRDLVIASSNFAVAIQGMFLGALVRAGRVRILAEPVTVATELEDRLRLEPWLYERAWYEDLNAMLSDTFRLAKAERGSVPIFLQNAALYLLQCRILCNRNSADKAVFGPDLRAYLREVAEVLKSVSDDVIFGSAPWLKLEFGIRLWLSRLARPREPEFLRDYVADVTFSRGSATRITAATVPVDIELLELDTEEDVLHISGSYAFPDNGEAMSLDFEVGDRSSRAEWSERFSATRTFGARVDSKMAFDVSVPLERAEEGSLRVFATSSAGTARVPLALRFSRPTSHLSTRAKLYWLTATRIFWATRSQVHFVTRTRKELLRREVALQWSLIRAHTKRSILVSALRLAFFVTAPFASRRAGTWIYFDKIYKAGDNGEYAYREAIRHKDGIRKAYILRGDVPDARRFRSMRLPYVGYGSLRHRLNFLHATVVFATHINPHNYGGFSGGLDEYFRGLFHYRVVAIQHGLTVQKLAPTVNRVFDNTSVYCLAAPAERANLTAPEYDYRDEQLVMTGLARYDGLRPRRSRRILFAPTWRSYLAAPASMGRSRGYNERFKQSNYFQLYQSIVEHPGLAAAAEKYSYQITLLLHPVISAQRDDFRSSGAVEVLAAADDVSYENILTTSSLMVTDYSGIQFDFAYMRRPIVYFQPPSLPASYEHGSYSYTDDALGEIVHDSEELVRTLVRYMERGCEVEPDYRARIDAFFAFSDRRNSARIYDVGRKLECDHR